MVLGLIGVGGVSASELVNRLNPTFERINTREGLSQTTVNVITQDSSGLVWIGTTEGLNIYDGEKFETFFNVQADLASLSHDYVSAIVEDSQRNIWIGTDNGLNVYNAATSTFRRVDIVDTKETTPPVTGRDSSVRTLFIASDDSLWVGTGAGLIKVTSDGSQTHYRHEATDPQTLGQGAVHAIAQDTQGNIWVGTNTSGLSRLSPASGEIIRFRRGFYESDLPGNVVRDLMVDPEGDLWVATYNGLWRGDTETLRFQYTPLVSDEGKVTTRTRNLLSDNEGRIWVGTDDGLFVLDQEAETSSNFTHKGSDPSSLSDNKVSALFEDAGRVIWVGTYNGISKWNSAAPRFALYKIDRNTEGELAGNSITSFAEDKTTLWIGTFTGLTAYDKASGEFRRMDDFALSDNRVMALAVEEQEENSTVWIGTMNGGLTAFTVNTGLTRRYTASSKASSLAGNQVSKIFVDSQKRVWVGLYGTGLDLYEGGTSFKHYPNNKAEFSDLRITDVAEDVLGNIWIASNGGGLMILDPENEVVTTLRHNVEDRSTIASDNLVSVSKGARGMWVGARDAGLSLVNPATLEVTLITKEDGLSSVAAYGVLEDDNLGAWVSGGKGLSVLREGGQWDIYDTSHGLQADDFNSGAYLRMMDGTFLYGGNSGFNAFNPLEIKSSTFSPKVELTGFKKLNKSVALDKSFVESSEIEIEHDDYVIEFEYGAMDYSSPSRNQYEYQLEGFEPDWVKAGNDRSVAYTNLDPGRYTFRVRATNGDGIWSSDRLAVELNVLPPWFQTWWAYSGYLILAILFLTGVYSLNSKRLARIAEDSHRARLEKYIQTLEQATDAIAIASEEGVIEYQNALFLALFKTPELASSDGSQLLEALFDSAEERAEVQSRVAESGRFSTEVVRRLAVDKFYEISVARTEYQGVVTLIAIARDITQRKETERQLEHYSRNLETQVAERTSSLEEEVNKSMLQQQALENSLVEKELLIKEVHHRVKNNMQVISSLLSIQAEGAGDSAYSSLLNESQQRIKSMALIHETLYQSDDLLKIDFQEYIELLTNSLSRSYVIPGVSVFVDVNVANVVLDLETAVPCGLIINELVSNSLKHAFHDKDETGIIQIDFVTDDCCFDLRIADNGSGLPAGFDLTKNTSMGLEIVTILTGQLEGTLSADNDEGAVFQIRFPRVTNE